MSDAAFIDYRQIGPINPRSYEERISAEQAGFIQKSAEATDQNALDSLIWFRNPETQHVDFDYATYLALLSRLPAEHLAPEFFRLPVAMILSRENRNAYMPVQSTYRDYLYDDHLIIPGAKLTRSDLFGYQDQDRIDSLMKRGEADTHIQIFDPKTIEADRSQIPVVSGAFAEASELMIAKEFSMFAHEDHLQYALWTREEVIGPDVDMRRAFNIHEDKYLRDKDGLLHGNIIRTWNAISHVPTAGFWGPLDELEDIRDSQSGAMAFADSEHDSIQRIIQVNNAHNAEFFYAPLNQIFGFMGGVETGGFQHCAQPMINGQYRDTLGQYQTLDRNVLRRMTTLFVIEPSN